MLNLHNLTVGHCNIQGGLTGISKTTQISQLIKKYDLDILSINETNLNAGISSDSLNIPIGYEFKRADRGTSTRGGCGILISNKCAYSPVKMTTNISTIEAFWIKIKNSNIFICGFYRSKGYCKLDDFLSYVADCMKKLKGKKVIWIGDLNVDQNKINDIDYKKFDTTLKSFNMVQIIQQYTRVAKRGDKFTYSTIDVIFTNCYSDFESSCVLPERPGDHYAIKCELNFKIELPPKFEKISFQNYSEKNITAFQTYLANLDLSHLLECNDIENAVSILDENLNRYHDYFFPVKTIKRHPKFIYKPSKESLDAINLKKKLHRKFKSKLKKVLNSSCAKNFKNGPWPVWLYT